MVTIGAAEELNKWEIMGGKPLWKTWVKQMKVKGHSKAIKTLDSTLKGI